MAEYHSRRKAINAMPFIPAENTAEVEIRMSLESQQVENTLYFRNDNPWDPADLTGLCSNIIDWWNGAFSPLVHTLIHLEEVVATDLTSETSSQASVGGGGLIGGKGGLCMPANVAYCVSFRTLNRGRSFRGRNYIAGISDADLSGVSSVSSAFSAAVVAAYNGLLTAAVPSTQHWVVVSRRENNAPRLAAVVTDITNVLTTDLTLDSMRRRLPGRGN